MQFICPGAALGEGQSLGLKLADQSLLAVRKHGQVYLYENRCPHRGVPLEWQADRFLDHSGSLIQCATHGALFLIDSGECVAGPCAGQALRALPCREDAQGIWLLKQPQAGSGQRP
ncbi:Rieske (2Fe-2S) protein [Pseudomonas sp. N040]|uniref:Rieske (2Fe-2S) protein n=1 Tax=Pseudomonas sp. N040 TaxID=2785325 RepID=UPI0018A2D306|nr:Rieske (2Fe-2S) protein [Pseudomonas sp. N040]MBF7730423.1 Rieske (2Fe-2S) protein [Pseudomonas sp. N040]MBW7014066.1 Rieske (2Fe-2S) protein [Pseudomonas sp. N040]